MIYGKLIINSIHKIKCKYKHNDEKCETCGIKYKYCNVFLNTQILKMIS